MEPRVLFAEEVYKIVGAAIEVHKELGAGFLEAVYQEALGIEMSSSGIPFGSQVSLPVHYKNTVLDKQYVADFVCFECVIVELKATDRLTSKDEAQILNYLKAARIKVGILINFGSSGKLEWKRFVY